MRLSRQILAVSGLLVMITFIAYAGFGVMGMAGIVMLYLAAVLLASYYLVLPVVLAGVFAAFLAINYFFVEPRYTFEVTHVESWVVLSGFLLVSVVVTSLVKRLQQQTQQANLARTRAEFSKQLAEHLAGSDDAQALLLSSCALIHGNSTQPVAIAHFDQDGRFALMASSAGAELVIDENAVRWAMQNGKAMGPATTNWPESEVCIIPFGRLPGSLPVLVLGNVREQTDEELQYLRAITDQVSIAYQRVISVEQARQSHLAAREESLRNALLSSLSHDMRTPLTAILGAATTLVAQKQQLEEREQVALLQSICSEATYLATATENILSLAQLNATKGTQLLLDWQSPEEIIGTTLARYRGRISPSRIIAEIMNAGILIKADASLLSQALANLIDNAIAVHQGEEPIVVAVEASDKILEIKVKDRGPGFPPEFNVNRIRKFSQGVRNGKGFGLGLAIVQAIAEVHQASFAVESRLGGGVVVTLGFPVANVDASHD
ncbi:MAG TPA: ATP-binding protein [Methylophilaceae bacterium]